MDVAETTRPQGGYDPEGASGLTFALLKASGIVVVIWLVAPIFIVVPIGFTSRRSYQFPPASWSLQWYQEFFSDPAWYHALMTSLMIGAIVATLATILGTAAALGVMRARGQGLFLINALILSPIIVPVVITGLGIYLVFLEWGLAGTPIGFVLAHLVLATPFVFVTVISSLRTFNRELERAAASLGAGPFVTFFRVTFPIIRPGIFAGALFAFIASFDEVVVSIFLADPDTRTLPVQMFSSTIQETDPTVAVASTIMLAIVGCALALIAWVKGRERAKDA